MDLMFALSPVNKVSLGDNTDEISKAHVFQIHSRLSALRQTFMGEEFPIKSGNFLRNLVVI